MWFTLGPSAPVGYSPRIFVKKDWEHRIDDKGQPTKVETAHLFLKGKCCWGGHDKVWGLEEGFQGEWWGYEIPHERYQECIDHLTGLLGAPVEAKTVRGD